MSMNWYLRRSAGGDISAETEPRTQPLDRDKFAQNCPGFIEWLDGEPTQTQIEELKARFG